MMEQDKSGCDNNLRPLRSCCATQTALIDAYLEVLEKVLRNVVASTMRVSSGSIASVSSEFWRKFALCA